MEFLDKLANVIYTKENIDRANEYILNRGINPKQLILPYTHTSSLEAHFWRFRDKYPPYLFVDSLYIPIVDIRDGRTLVGFDIRYNGKSPKRARWYKLKRKDGDIFVYNFQEFKENMDRPVLIVESALDVETIRGLNLDVTCISFLTAISNFRSILFLYAMGNRIYYMFDGDSGGSSAISRILKTISINTEVMNNFTFISYRGKDVNEALKVLGPSYLSQTIQAQI